MKQASIPNKTLNIKYSRIKGSNISKFNPHKIFWMMDTSKDVLKHVLKHLEQIKLKGEGVR